MHDQDLWFGMSYGIFKLLKGKSPVEHGQGCTHHGHGKITFEKPMGVIINDAHYVSGFYPEFIKPACKPVYTFEEGAVGKSRTVPVYDLLIFGIPHRRAQKLLDDQRIFIVMTCC